MRLGDLGGGTDWASWQWDPRVNQRESLLEGSPFNRELEGDAVPGWGGRDAERVGPRAPSRTQTGEPECSAPRPTPFKDCTRSQLPFLGQL